MNSSIVKLLAGVFVVVSTTVSIAFVIDERYAHASDVTSAKQSLEKRVDRAVLENRKWNIEDKLQTIEMKSESQRSSFEKAQASRYTRELDSVNRAIEQLKK